MISNILDGKEFCVLSATSKLSKPSIEKKIIENGGTIVQNPGITFINQSFSSFSEQTSINMKYILFEVILTNRFSNIACSTKNKH